MPLGLKSSSCASDCVAPASSPDRVCSVALLLQAAAAWREKSRDGFQESPNVSLFVKQPSPARSRGVYAALTVGDRRRVVAAAESVVICATDPPPPVAYLAW